MFSVSLVVAVVAVEAVVEVQEQEKEVQPSPQLYSHLQHQNCWPCDGQAYCVHDVNWLPS